MPELKRLDAEDNELPEGLVEVERSETLHVGLYVQASTDGASPIDDSLLGFESLFGAIHFESDSLGTADIGAILRRLRDGEGWARRMTTSSFDPGQDELLGPPAEGQDESSWVFFWDDATNGDDSPRGGWCAPANGSCGILLGVLRIPLNDLPPAASGDLSLSIGGLFDPGDPIGAGTMFSRAEDHVAEGNSVSYSLCAETGCPTSVTFEAEEYQLEEGAELELTLILDEALGGDVVVPIQVAESSSSAESLYRLSTQSLTFAAGETSKKLRVTAVENEEDEELETATLVLEMGDLPSSLLRGAISSTRINIQDNDHPGVALSFGAASYTAREGGAAAEVSVILSAPPEREVTIAISTELRGGASAGDFEGVPQSVTFGPEDTEKSFGIVALEETDKDVGEGLRLSFADLPPGVTEGNHSTAMVDLRDNDSDAITLSVSHGSVAEEAGTLDIRVTASLLLSSADSLSEDLNVPLTLSGSAVSGTDYSLPGQVPAIVIPANSSSGDSVEVTLTLTLLDDEIVEGNRILSIGSSLAGFDVNPAEIEITDSDGASLSVTGPDQAVPEGGEASFVVSLSKPVDAEVLVNWTIVDGSAVVSEDLNTETLSGSLTFPAGSGEGATQSVEIQVTDDEFSEADETFSFRLQAVTAQGVEDGRVRVDEDASSAEVTISASDPLTLSLSGPPFALEAVTVTYTLRLVGGIPSEDITATLAVAKESTATPEDYSGLPGSVTIPSGESSASFTVTFVRDQVAEGEESLILELTGVEGGGGPEISVDPDANRVHTRILELSFVWIPNTEVGSTEGHTMEVSVVVDPPLKAADVTVSYALEPASAGVEDFSDVSGGSIRIAAGESSGGIRVMALDDRLSEQAESFSVKLTGVEASNPEAAPVELVAQESQTTANATIEASDPLSVSVRGPSEIREGSQATYVLGLEGGESTADISLTPTFGLASEADASDVSGLGENLTISAGLASIAFTVEALSDGSDEGQERLVVEFSNLRGGGGGGLSLAADADSTEVLITEEHLEARAEAMKFALAGIGRTLGDNFVEMLGERTAGTGAEDSHVTLGGRALDLKSLSFDSQDRGLSGWVDAAMDVLGVNLDSPDGLVSEMARATGVTRGEFRLDLLPDARDLLSGSSFAFGLGGEDGKAASWTLWGSGDLTRFEGRPADHFQMSGEVVGGHIGLDYRASETVLAGLVLSQNSADVEYALRGEVGTEGRLELRLTSAHPYMHWSPSEGLGLWGSLGYGVGDALLRDEKGEAETSVSLKMAVVGARRELTPLGGFAFAFKTDAYLVRMRAQEQIGLLGVEADSSRARLAVEASRSLEFRGGSLVTGNVELGARADGGDAEQGAGAELRAGLAYSHPAGFDVQASGHMLLAHEESGFKQWGASLNLSFDRGVRGQGLQFLLAPSWGTPAMGAEGIWMSGRTTEAFLADDFGQGMTLETRLAYAMELTRRRGLLTFFGELGKSGEFAPSLRLGTQLGGLQTLHSNIDFELYGERLGARLGRDPEYGLVFKIRGNF